MLGLAAIVFINTSEKFSDQAFQKKVLDIKKSEVERPFLPASQNIWGIHVMNIHPQQRFEQNNTLKYN